MKKNYFKHKTRTAQLGQITYDAIYENNRNSELKKCRNEYRDSYTKCARNNHVPKLNYLDEKFH